MPKKNRKSNGNRFHMEVYRRFIVGIMTKEDQVNNLTLPTNMVASENWGPPLYANPSPY